MKKLVFVAAILVILAGAGYGYYEYQRQNLRASLDEVIIPYLKEEFKAQTGNELKVAYEQAELAGRELKVENLAFDFESNGQNHLDWEKVRLKARGWSWLWGAYVFDIEADKNTSRLPKALVTIAKSHGRGLAMKQGGQSLAMEEMSYSDIVVKVDNPKGKAEEFKADELKLTGIKSSFGAKGGKFSSSVKSVSLSSGDYQAVFKDLSAAGQGLFMAEKFSMRGDYDLAVGSFKVGKKQETLVSAGAFESSHKADGKGYREKASLKKLSFAIPEKLDEQDFTYLHKAGIKNIVLDASTAFSYRTEGAVTDLESFVLNAENLGRLELGCLLENLALDDFKDPKLDDKKSLRLLGAAKLAGLDLAYHDRGLVPKIYEIAADIKKQTPQQIRVAAAGGVAIAAFGVANDSRALSRVLVAVSAFLNDPKSICISLKPEKPVPFASMLSPDWQPLVKMLKPVAGDCSAKNKAKAK